MASSDRAAALRLPVEAQLLPMRMGEIRRTTTFRLTAMLGLVFLLAITTLVGLLFLGTERELAARTDAVLGKEVRKFTAAPASREAGEDIARVRAAIANDSSGFNHFALVAPGGAILAGNFAPPLSAPRHLPWWADIVMADGTPLRVVAVGDGGGRTLYIGRDVTQIEYLRSRVLMVLISSGIVTAIGMTVAAILLSIAPLRRIHLLTTLAGRIAQGELALRMPVSKRGDELDRIAGTINVMVEEIARLLEQVKGATDAIAHDLRTPLSALHARLATLRRASDGELALPAPAMPPAFGDVIDGALEELDLVLSRFNALLRIAELEATNRQAGFGSVDLMTLAAKVCELFEPLAEERHIDLVLSGAWGHIVHGDERLLFEALSNLVENAIKFNQPGGHVTVAIAAHGAVDMLTVRDDGPGIPPEERALVLRKFLRGEGARHVPGSGLGLSLVASIVHLHGFAMELRDAGPGLEACILCVRRHGIVN